MRNGALCFLLLLFAALFPPRASGAAPVHAVASFTIIADLVHQIGGPRVAVSSLVGADGDPHQFEPSPADARQIETADIVFANGLGLDGWLQRLTAAASYRGDVAVLSTGVKVRTAREGGEEIPDPHAWNDPANAVIYVENIVAALSKADPAGAKFYADNGKNYIEEIKKMDAAAKQAFADIGKSQRKILVSHDALGYFGEAYGIAILSVDGLSNEGEPSAGALAKLVARLKNEQVQVYFIESANSPRLVQEIAKAAGARFAGTLYVEALSRADGPAASFMDMFRHNVEIVAKALIPGSG
jgi:zinc/manganese transport system substrate-binding protein